MALPTRACRTIREHHEKSRPFVVYDVQPRSLPSVDKLWIIKG